MEAEIITLIRMILNKHFFQRRTCSPITQFCKGADGDRLCIADIEDMVIRMLF